MKYYTRAEIQALSLLYSKSSSINKEIMLKKSSQPSKLSMCSILYSKLGSEYKPNFVQTKTPSKTSIQARISLVDMPNSEYQVISYLSNTTRLSTMSCSSDN